MESSSSRNPPGNLPHQPARGRQRIRGQRQAGAQQQRAQRDGGPVDQHALAQRPQTAHAPDVVERTVDGEDQRQRGGQQHGKTPPPQPVGLGRELREVAQHLARDVVGHQALDQPALQHILQLAEHGEGREHGQRHRNEGHQRQDGGEGQAAGRQAQAVFTEALAQGVGRGAQGKCESSSGRACRRCTTDCREKGMAAMMPSAMHPSDAPALPLPLDHTRWVDATRRTAVGSLLALIALCLAWELVLAPLRPGGSWLALKACRCAFRWRAS
jgi:hypothetical protein